MVSLPTIMAIESCATMLYHPYSKIFMRIKLFIASALLVLFNLKILNYPKTYFELLQLEK